MRAELVREVSPEGDGEAQTRLCDGMRVDPAPAFEHHLAARTRFFDGAVVAAVARGVTQIVVLGAGYDDRALRFRFAGVRYFELDHPDTQQDKRARLRHLDATDDGPILAPIDFRTDDVAGVLTGHGHDPDAASLFLCEGLLVYLDRATITRLLTALAARSARGSELAASLAVHPEGIDSEWVVRRANAGRANAPTEPWRTILTRPDQLTLLSDGGWSVLSAAEDDAFEAGAARRSSWLVTARPRDHLDARKAVLEAG